MEILFVLQGVLILMIIFVLFSVTEFVYSPTSRLEVEIAMGALFSASSCCFAPSGLALVLVVGLYFYEGRFDFGEKHRRRVILGLFCLSLPLLFVILLLVMAGGRGSQIVFIIFRYAPVMMVFFELAKLLFVLHLLKPRQRQLLLGLGLVFFFLLGLYYYGLTMLEPTESWEPVTTLELRLAYLSMLTIYWIGIYELVYLKFVHDLRKRMKTGELRPAPDILTGPGARYFQEFIPQPAPFPGPSSQSPGEGTVPGSRATDPRENQEPGKE